MDGARPSSPSDAAGNRLLDALPEHDRERFVRRAELVHMPVGAIAFHRDEDILAVHFPVRGVLSLITTTQDGATIEVSTLGNEGTTGVPIFLGATSQKHVRCISQVEGAAWRIPSAEFREECETSARLQTIMNRYTAALLTQVGQSVACSRLHSTSQRCARWLLMTNDRAGSDEFILTQEFLAYMLGVRRGSVTIALGPLRRAGMVSYSRGHLKILDRERLHEAACECYDIMHEAFEGMFD